MKDPMVEKINALRKERNAIILAHNYQLPEIQDIADYVGDSLELAKKAVQVDCETIVFCGVKFMAETAHILNPEKTVVMPDPTADCPLARMVELEDILKLKAEHPTAYVVCYVNSTAEVKAESDVCCTSANAVNVVRNLNSNKPIIFIPDRHLGGYVEKVLGKSLILPRGYCPTHRHILVEDILQRKKEMPDARVIVHPECTEDVIAIADAVGSTSQIKKAVEKFDAKRFIIGTEVGMLHVLSKAYPDREFFAPSSRCECPNMKKTTLEKVLWVLETLEYKITVEPETAKRALKSIERMLEYV